MPRCFLAGKKIVVLGGGIAGLAFVAALACIWQELWGPFPDIVLYEREARVDESTRHDDVCRTGYSLSIRSGASSAGIQTARKMRILDALLAVGITRESREGGFLGFWSPSWKPMVRKRKHVKPGLPVHAVRVQRTDLRMVLLKVAGEHAKIVWGVACTQLIPAEQSNGRIRLQLSDNENELEECDFVVVADGANSKLRARLHPDHTRNDTSHESTIVLIAGVSRFDHGAPEPFARDWGILPNGHGVALFVAPMDERCLNWTLSYRSKMPRPEQHQPMSSQAAEALLQEAHRLGATFCSDTVRDLLSQTDSTTLSVRNSYDRAPFAHGKHNGIPDGIVFIGDSNHAVTPFAGNGANMALRDGYDLATLLCRHDNVQSAVKAYDALSIPRAYRAARRSWWVVAMVHSEGITWLLLRALLFVAGIVMEMWYRLGDAIGALYHVQVGKKGA